MESSPSSSTLHNRRAGASSSTSATNNNNVGSASQSSKKTNQGHISERSMTLSNWHEHINWLNTTLIVIVPAIGFLMAPFVQLRLKTFILAVILYSLSGFGITAGYHRLWSHRAYSARLPLRIFLAFIGGGAVEGSIRWWSNGHRTHHRFTDTDKDPYNVKRGLMYAHMGWMVLKSNPKLKGRTDISDLNADPVVRWQHRNYVFVLMFMGFILPTLIAGFGWGDWMGGFVYGGILRVCCIHHATFCVNSLAHYIGEQPFDDRRSPRDHVLTALVTFGEGYHNFHHEFPSDYRNAIKWYQYDPTKLLIKACYYLGLAYDLKTFSANAIQQGLVQQQQKKIDQWRSRLDWGVPLEQLPVMDFDDFKDKSKERSLIVVAGVVHDVTDFIDEHPGGKALIESGIGKDATANFNGGVYDHSNAAHNVLSTKRVAVIRGGGEVEIWKQAHLEKKDATIAVDSYNRPIVRAGNQVSRVVVPVPGADAA